ncbi:PLDc N-terminal domain-containing protein [Leifsonia sp. NPDC077715]|uniref:PLD nuclease N-terminal domain-containing protein n=1 Tax=Leifsonia sp. NPDC077715 TaxID=3155539 RepID=UPI00341855BC
MVLLPLIVFALFVFALVDIILRRQDQVKHLPKVAWVFIVILLPLVGSILWFAVGREYEPSTQRRTLRMPTVGRPATAPSPVEYSARRETDPLSTEAQLAALEREIEQAERDQRIRQLEQELRRRNDADEPA